MRTYCHKKENKPKILIAYGKELLDTLNPNLVTEMEINESETEICIKIKRLVIPPTLG